MSHRPVFIQKTEFEPPSLKGSSIFKFQSLEFNRSFKNMFRNRNDSVSKCQQCTNHSKIDLLGKLRICQKVHENKMKLCIILSDYPIWSQIGNNRLNDIANPFLCRMFLDDAIEPFFSTESHMDWVHTHHQNHDATKHRSKGLEELFIKVRIKR